MVYKHSWRGRPSRLKRKQWNKRTNRIKRNKRLSREKALVELFELGDPKTMTDEAVGKAFAEAIGQHEGDKPTIVTDPKTGRQFRLITAYAVGRKTGNRRVIGGTGDQGGRETPEENIHAMIEEVRRA